MPGIRHTIRAFALKPRRGYFVLAPLHAFRHAFDTLDMVRAGNSLVTAGDMVFLRIFTAFSVSGINLSVVAILFEDDKCNKDLEKSISAVATDSNSIGLSPVSSSNSINALTFLSWIFLIIPAMRLSAGNAILELRPRTFVDFEFFLTMVTSFYPVPANFWLACSRVCDSNNAFHAQPSFGGNAPGNLRLIHLSLHDISSGKFFYPVVGILSYLVLNKST
jgi:hypothetical protein